MDDIYSRFPLSEIPWNNETPPYPLVELVESGKVKPCKAVDLGCGAGNFVVYLASLGFSMTGLDVSPNAIQIAKNIKAKFIAIDLLGNLKGYKDTFDFAFDFEVLHHFSPKQRDKYVKNVFGLLNPGAKYLSISFSEIDQSFGGIGKYRKTVLGTELYFSSEEELNVLFNPYFKISEVKTIELKSKKATHMACYIFMEKR